MQSVVKRAVLLLLVAAIASNAAPTPEECEGLVRKPPNKDLHEEFFGDWVLVWSVSDHEEGWALLPNVSSSHIELRLLPDNKTVQLKERNLYNDQSCYTFVLNMSAPSDPSHQHTLETIIATVEKNGVTEPFNDSSVLTVYESCSNCLMMIYKSTQGQYLLNYRREGHHSDVEQLKATHDDYRKHAECLGFPLHKLFTYDGAADFCHKKSSPESRMQSVVKRAVLLLLVAAIASNAALTPEECEGLVRKPPNKDLHEDLFRDWVLVWSVSDHEEGWEILPELSSSHIELRLLPDNQTVQLIERNLMINNSCYTFVINMTAPSDPSHQHALEVISVTMDKDGEVQPYNYSGVVTFYESCSNCLMMIYKSTQGQYLLNYRREGHHSDVEQLKATHDDYRKHAECLGFPLHKLFTYDGAADFCHKKSSPEVKQDKECEGLVKKPPNKDLHEDLFRDWVLVWSVSDHEQGWEILPDLSSSHVELRVLPDNKTFQIIERNLMINNSCYTFVINMTAPSDPSHQHALEVISVTMDKDGEVQPYNYSGVVTFYESCSNCVTLIYKSTQGRFLLNYRREGHHSDVEQLKATHDDYRKHAECLGFPLHKLFTYDGAADFCHKKSSPEVKQQES
ncbi:saxitoxin and tetrodotoxin-binding protein 1-like [Toxotes jaculatrix]|uniref:saxitoxin and tetrodotoxin-binding protein 1-like n=1 Tax=Toxotes jaculatrix TaxID=941984 RepID=UPI001B3AAC24|nr:saxitoxin and tetrodotoxin-binding protein 1-like [Toxotes jaculatrix]